MESIRPQALDELRAALADTAPYISTLAAADRASLLKTAVFAAVDELRALGLPSPSVEATLLSIVDASWPVSGGTAPVDDIRAWCIQRYFKPLP